MSGSFFSNVLHGAKYRAQKLFSGKRSAIGLSRYSQWKLKHLPRNNAHTLQLKDKTIHFSSGPDLLHSLKEIFIEEVYKIPFTNEAPYILDCGANIGLATLYLKAHYPNARVVAFEPDSTNFFFLEKNVAANALTNVELRKEAVWKEDTTLHFANEGTLGGKISSHGSNVVEVKATRLRNLLDRQVDFLKMDIEGAEYEVLKDCADKLQLVDYLFIEFHGYFNKANQLTDILHIAENSGFTYYIREAAAVYPTPFFRERKADYDLQLNIFCFRNNA